MSHVLMVQGTSSGVGKSLITMAICRHFVNLGYKVAPFKSQNMSLNSAVSIEGGEMSRAQYLQALACEEAPSVKMNPILLKPEIDGSQIVVLGKPYGYFKAKDYMYSKKESFLSLALDALEELMKSHDIIVIEGAGSPVEINLKSHDIVNMRIAKSVNAPVILVADIERGGAFAQVVGTMELLDEDERKLVKGFIFNKFMGDKSLLGDYPFRIAKRYGIKFLGTMPYKSHKIPQEDSMVDWSAKTEGDLKINIIHLPHISNFDDFDPLMENASVTFVEGGSLNGDVIIIPGTKMTIEDLEWLRGKNFDREIRSAIKRGAHVVGICGGYQMMGKMLRDPQKSMQVEGLGILPVITEFEVEKRVSNLVGYEKLTGKALKIKGYEIHHGISYAEDDSPFAMVEEVNGIKTSYPDGYKNGRAFGTYFHGLFRNFEFTRDFLNMVRRSKGMEEKDVKEISITEEIDRFTDLFEENIDVKSIENML